VPSKCALRLCDVVQAVWADLAELKWPQVACAVVQGFPLGAEELATGAYKGLEGLGAGEHDELCGSGGSKVRDAGVVGVCAGQAQSPVTEGGSALYLIHYIIIIIIIHSSTQKFHIDMTGIILVGIILIQDKWTYWMGGGGQIDTYAQHY
jgi:hypothetical protein